MIDLELNGMGYGEIPPPLPVKSSDYGNLMENPEQPSPTTPPPPPLHHRVKHMSIHRHPRTFHAINEDIICNSKYCFRKFKMAIGSTRTDTKYASDLCLLVNWLENSPVNTATLYVEHREAMNEYTSCCLIFIHYLALLTHFVFSFLFGVFFFPLQDLVCLSDFSYLCFPLLIATLSFRALFNWTNLFYLLPFSGGNH